MEVPRYPVHGQSVERAVKEVTAAAISVYGPECRDGWVRARLAHRVITGGGGQSRARSVTRRSVANKHVKCVKALSLGSKSFKSVLAFQ